MRWPAALLLLLAPACSFDVDYGDTTFRCDESDGCPVGYHCEGDRCVEDGDEPADLAYSRQLVIPAGRVAADLIGYPLLVAPPPDPALADHARDDGTDIAFLDMAGELLPFEIESWDPAEGALVAWVHLPELRAAETTILQLAYGGEPAEREDAPAVWADFLGVWHLAGPAPAADSTGRGASGMPVDETWGADSRLGVAALLDGGFIDFGDPADGHADFDAGDGLTLSAWYRVDAITGTWQTLAGKGGLSESAAGYGFETSESNDGVTPCLSNGAASRCLGYVDMAPIGTWTLLAMAVDRDDERLLFYRDGVLEGSRGDIEGFDPGGEANSHPLRLGANDTGSFLWPGAADELRLSGAARSAAWMQADFDSQREGSTFVEIGPEQPPAAP